MHEPARRTVLGAGLGLLGLAVVGVDETAAGAATAPAPARADYLPAVGKVFTAVHAGRVHRLRLTAVRSLQHASAANRQRCFSLLLAPTGTQALPDGIYRLVRAGVATHSLFLANVGTGNTLQAVVNRAR